MHPQAVERQFALYGPSHWATLALFAVGAVVLVVLARRPATADAVRRCARGLAVFALALQLGSFVYYMLPGQWSLQESLPLQLSDLAGLVTAYALWSHRYWAFSLTYYWGLTLSTQALITPVYRGPDFPYWEFVLFWAWHLFVVWAAIYLTWGRRMRPSWRSYWIAAVVTVTWAVTVLVFNAVAGTNYGYLNAKPDTWSVLELMGDWPWYVLVESTLVLGVWAVVMTLPWTRRSRREAPRRGRE
ncbi:YwaF family protein [Longimycelium tulufanense]|uniref:YwaF family protein n=1 Tax=Longimycelium tulufanense TaxID=907463 RepID=UPI001E51526B|nr:TIGR02206 family membrane protein [Longimycelium tulufanense]